MATDDPPKPPIEPPGAPPGAPAGELPVEDTDTSATPPERDADAPAARPPLEDVVASLIDEKPTRPHLVVVPSEPEPEPAPRPKRKADEDPLAFVLDGAEPKPDEPETLEDAWKAAKAEVAKVDLGKILDFGGFATGLKQLASWVEKQIPTLNAAVSRFLNTVEEVLTTPGPTSTSNPSQGEAEKKPVIAVVPDAPPEDKVGEEAKAMETTQTTQEPDGEPKAAAPETDPPAPPMKDPEPGPDPAPVHDPEPTPDPNPGTDPLPIGDPVPKRDPVPGDPAPIRDPVPPPDPNPGTDPLPMGDPMPGPDANPGTDPLPMGDPVTMPTMGSSNGGAADAGDDIDPDPNPLATD